MASVYMSSSPTARLLRHSKLFSLPPTLPAANLDQPIGTQGVVRTSKHATLPYPVRQTIATPSKSRLRGEWGLKRPLPVKTTNRTNLPNIALIEWDSREKVTDFESTNQHAMSVRKFEQMGIAFTHQNSAAANEHKRRFVSAFDPTFDNTYTDLLPGDARKRAEQSGRTEHMEKLIARAWSPEYGIFGVAAVNSWARKPSVSFANSSPESVQSSTSVVGGSRAQAEAQDAMKVRWKYKGPWLGLMSEGDFLQYVDQVKKKRGQFAAFVREYALERLQIESARKAREESRALQMKAQAKAESASSSDAVAENAGALEERGPIVGLSVSEIRSRLDAGSDVALQTEYDEIVRDLIHQHSTRSSFTTLSLLIRVFLDLPPIEWEHQYKLLSDSDFPLSTHPSAGLSYLRSNSRMANHPLGGPLAARQCVQARILSLADRSAPDGHARLGVAGFVVPVPETFTTFTIGGRTVQNFAAREGEYDSHLGPSTSMAASNVHARLGGSRSSVFSTVASVSHDLNGQFRRSDPTRTEGGPKVWVVPEEAQVDSFGRVHVGIRPCPEASHWVQENEVRQIGASMKGMNRSRLHLVNSQMSYEEDVERRRQARQRQQQNWGWSQGRRGQLQSQEWSPQEGRGRRGENTGSAGREWRPEA